MENKEESARARGESAAWLSMLHLCCKSLGYNHPDVEKSAWIETKEAVISILRIICEEFGDNEWEEDSFMVDIIEKHLLRNLRANYKYSEEEKQQRGQNIFNQNEAMALMWYQCQSCHEMERVWNSRPRVTPGIISCTCGGEMNHVNHKNDVFAPNHTPKKGDRIFVDWSKESYESWYKKVIAENWEKDGYRHIKEMFKTQENALADMLAGWEFGQPHLIEI